MKTLGRAGLVAWILVQARSAYSQIVWDKTIVDLFPPGCAVEAKSEFEFVNAGPKSVSFLEIKPNCGCVTVATDKKAYRPGERGKLIATFGFGERVGLQEKSILVRTDSHTNSDSVLSMNVTIPELVKVSPRHLSWSVGGEKDEKFIYISAPTREPIRILGVSVSGHRLAAKLLERTPGIEYRISVVPKDVSRPCLEVIYIEVFCGEGESKIIRAFASVKPPTEFLQKELQSHEE